MKSWINDARKGDFATIPQGMLYEDGGDELAFLIDACAIAGGVTKCAEIAWPIIAQVRARGESSAPALDQWLALNYQVRRYQKSGSASTGSALAEMNALTRSLREALVNLTPKAKAGILSLIDEEVTQA